ncbi:MULTISPECIES: DUF2937 family protein [unclassified Marinovum]
MFAKALTLAGGITGAAGLSQFPEFSQQYAQRLGGAVDELSRVVTEFDADAADLGLTRAAALTDLAQGSDMGLARARSIQTTFRRHAQLSADLAALDGAGPFTRAYLASRMTDSDVAKRAWEVYKPAVPVTFEGAVFAGVGFVGGMMILVALMSMLRRLLRRNPAQRTQRAPG